jgi:isopentenyl-diphosphate delta-isomerase
MRISHMNAEQVILVDAQDNEIGRMEKQEAHEKGCLHRAFSVFVYNSVGDLLLQRRALHKYHSGGLWTNTCCSHPRPGEANHAAAKRRLKEEMGFECTLMKAFTFLYHQEVGELTEHELDHVFIGSFDGVPVIDPEEVAEWRFVSIEDLQHEMASNPENFTVWFRLCLDRVQRFKATGGASHDPQIAYLF